MRKKTSDRSDDLDLEAILDQVAAEIAANGLPTDEELHCEVAKMNAGTSGDQPSPQEVMNELYRSYPTKDVAASFSAVCWEHPYRGDTGMAIGVEGIESFSARGKQRIYRREDRFGKRAGFFMDIWRDRQARLLVRFWSRSTDVGDESWEVLGETRLLLADALVDDASIPDELRRRYSDWVIAYL